MFLRLFIYAFCWHNKNRSIRRSVRSGSIKLKQTYEHLMENGDIGGINRVSSASRRPHDLDIKLLQAKRQQAEMRRYRNYFWDFWNFHNLLSYTIYSFIPETNAKMICERTIHSSIRRCLRYLAKVNSGNIASYSSTRDTTRDWRILWQARKGKCSTRVYSKYRKIETYCLVVVAKLANSVFPPAISLV